MPPGKSTGLPESSFLRCYSDKFGLLFPLPIPPILLYRKSLFIRSKISGHENKRERELSLKIIDYISLYAKTKIFIFILHKYIQDFVKYIFKLKKNQTVNIRVYSFN